MATALALALISVPSGSGARQAIDTERSSMMVHVFKSGLFRAFADNHDIRAPIKEGSVDEAPNPRVRVVVDAGRMQVLDPGLPARDRDQVQARMLGPEVLDSSRFPEIRFESTSVEPLASGGWTVRGRLTLHGVSRPVAVKVVRRQDHYRGSASLRQTDFSIAPISIAGGAVKVKDEVKIDFDVFTRSTSSSAVPLPGRRQPDMGQPDKK